MKIRQAYEKDKKALQEICLSNASLYDSIIPGGMKRQGEKFLKNLSLNYELKIIEVDDKIVGFLGMVILDEATSYLVALYFHNQYQGKGYGSKVLDQLNITLLLLVHKNATWAIQFYKKNGFNIITKEALEIKNYQEGLLKKWYLKDTILMKRNSC